MSGSLLGPDQIKKVNASFPALVKHIRSLLAADHTGLGMMRVHCMVESFDSDEMATIFRELSFISPIEKKALVRAAIYELLAKEPALFVAPEVSGVTPQMVGNQLGKQGSVAALAQTAPQVFTPPQFKLNVNTSSANETAKTDTKPEPPAATSTHTPIVAKQVEDGNKRMEEHQKKLETAVAKFREVNTPKAITIPVVPADADLQAIRAEAEELEAFNDRVEDALASQPPVEE